MVGTTNAEAVEQIVHVRSVNSNYIFASTDDGSLSMFLAVDRLPEGEQIATGDAFEVVRVAC